MLSLLLSVSALSFSLPFLNSAGHRCASKHCVSSRTCQGRREEEDLPGTRNAKDLGLELGTATRITRTCGSFCVKICVFFLSKVKMISSALFLHSGAFCCEALRHRFSHAESVWYFLLKPTFKLNYRHMLYYYYIKPKLMMVWQHALEGVFNVQIGWRDLFCSVCSGCYQDTCCCGGSPARICAIIRVRAPDRNGARSNDQCGLLSNYLTWSHHLSFRHCGSYSFAMVCV